MTHDIKVLGAGCAKCKATLALFQRVIAAEGYDARLSKVEDMAEIMSHGIMSTPGIMVDGEMKLVGRVPGRDQIREWLAEPGQPAGKETR